MALKHRTRSLAARIYDSYPHLPNAERKLADVILACADDIAAYSATELAAQAGVSKAAASRLFRRLGFRNYAEARRNARESRRSGSARARPTMQNPDQASAADLDSYVQGEQALLAKTFEQLDPAQIDRVVERLVAARRVWVLGFRSANFLAGYFRLRLLQVRPDVSLLAGTGETLAERLADCGASDLLVAIGSRRPVKRWSEVLRRLRAARVPILHIGDNGARRTPALATWSIRCEVGQGAHDSAVGMLSVLHYLAIEAMRRAGPEGQRRLQSIARYHDLLGECC